jgi:hypothetical protein
MKRFLVWLLFVCETIDNAEQEVLDSDSLSYFHLLLGSGKVSQWMKCTQFWFPA